MLNLLRLPVKKSFFASWLMSMKMGLLGSKKKWAGGQWHETAHVGALASTYHMIYIYIHLIEIYTMLHLHP